MENDAKQYIELLKKQVIASLYTTDKECADLTKCFVFWDLKAHSEGNDLTFDTVTQLLEAKKNLEAYENRMSTIIHDKMVKLAEKDLAI